MQPQEHLGLQHNSGLAKWPAGSGSPVRPCKSKHGQGHQEASKRPEDGLNSHQKGLLGYQEDHQQQGHCPKLHLHLLQQSAMEHVTTQGRAVGKVSGKESRNNGAGVAW